jgi:hypothetical protein
MNGRVEYLTDDGLQVLAFVSLPKETIDQVFAEAEHQADYLFGLYRAVYPNWDQIEKVHGWPTITKHTWHYICDLAMAFDKEHHPSVMAGGLWMNNGFRSVSTEEDETFGVENWQVVPARFTEAT